MNGGHLKSLRERLEPGTLGCLRRYVAIFLPRKTDRRMFTSLMMLAAEANGVVTLRMMKLMRGGNGARSEAELMVREKIDAALDASAFEQAQFGSKPKKKTTSKVVTRSSTTFFPCSVHGTF